MTASASSRVTCSSEPELVALRKLAENLASKGKTDKTTTGHLLAAIASSPGAAADLLCERRLDAAVLLSAARVTTDDERDAIQRAMQRARELANRSGARAPSSMHLLFSLCQDRASAAHRALVQCGADVTKLRMAAMQLAMGIAPARRQPSASPPARAASPRSCARASSRPAPSPSRALRRGQPPGLSFSNTQLSQ